VTPDESTGAPIDEDARRRFEAAWREGRPAPIEDFLPPADSPLRPTTLVELVFIDLECCWRRFRADAGTPPYSVEGYVDRFPELADPTILNRLVREEWQVRHRFGQTPDRSEYEARFPDLFASTDAALTLVQPVQPTRKARDSDARLPAIPGHDLLRLLGRGGMGAVYLARQRRLGRQVAVKVIRGGGAGPSELARFQSEAAAVARLQHPNVVQVFETGEWEPDPGAPPLPYFTMEYVPGGSLAARLDGRPWPPTAAARLVETLARAVHAAHVVGIVHRDLKPGNILVGNDQGPRSNDQQQPTGHWSLDIGHWSFQPKVTDFGLAKFLEQDSGQTRSGDVIGTPSYMSPEQAAGRVRSVGPPADIWALGAILYELLTGRPPFRGETTWDTLQQVLREEPVPPRRLVPRLPRDLETIALKCLEKEQARRYASADELAEDLRRFRADEPIRARPVGWTGRARKWAKRRPTAAGLAGLGALIPIGLAVVGFWYLDRLRWEKEQETRRAEESRREQAATARQRDEAEENLELAFDGMTRMVARARDTRVIGTPQGEMAVRGLLEDAVEFCERFLQKKGDSPRYRRSAAMAHRLLGNVRRHTGQFDLAVASYRAAIDLHEGLVAEFPADPLYLEDLAGTHLNRAHLRADRNQPAEAEADYQRAIDIRRRLADANRGNVAYVRELAVARYNLGAFLSDLGDLDRARPEYEAALDLLRPLLDDRPDDPEVQNAYATAATNLGLDWRHKERWVEAGAILTKAIDLHRKLVDRQPDDPLRRYQLANSLNSLGLAQAGAGRPKDAEDHFREAIGLQRRLAADHPSVPAYHAELGMTLSNLADRLIRRGDAAEARRHLDEAVRHQQLARKANPTNAKYRQFLANHYAALGDAALALKDHAAVVAAATGLATTGTQMQDALDAASQVARCIPLAGQDPTLTPEQKRQKAADYGEAAVKLIRLAFDRGLSNADPVRTNPDFASLEGRTDYRALLGERAKK
jgi:eukaryotic-like serine/threonine-protein kinase